MAKTQALAPGVWQLTVFPYINVFAIEEDDGLTIVDTGLKRSAPRIREGLAAIGKQPADVKRFVLTHWHNDHAGSIAALRSSIAADVIAHEADAEIIAGAKPPVFDPEAGRVAKVLRAMARPGASVAVDRTVREGDHISSLRVLHTPGHSPGHISLLDERNGLLIAGDALFNVAGLRYSIAFPCSSVALSHQSVERFHDGDYDAIAFAHGRPIMGGAREKVRAFLRTR